MCKDASSRFCRQCGYSLQGLLRHECPECANPFDPEDASSFLTDRRALFWIPWNRFLRRAAANPIVAVPLLWSGLVTVLFAPIALFAGVTALHIAYKDRRWVCGFLIIVLSPFSVFSGKAAIDYASGNGRILFPGYPTTEAHNIDRFFRCERQNTGCCIDGSEFITHGVYNSALQSLILAFGPMPGSYLGPYPSRAECLEALASAEAIELNDLVKDRVVLGDNTFKLDTGVGAGLINRMAWSYFQNSKPELDLLLQEIGPITAATCRGCLAIKIPSYLHSIQNDVPSAMVVVLDFGTGRPFAYYGTGDYRNPFPPVRWRP